jgi:hypothetical protein
MRKRDWRRVLLGWVLLLCLWVALTDTVKVQELVAGAVVAAAGVALAALVERDRERREAQRPGPSQLLRPLTQLPLDTARLGFALLRRLGGAPPPAGAFRREPLEGAPLFAEWWGSLSPGRYVVGTDPEDGSMLVHEMRREDPD